MKISLQQDEWIIGQPLTDADASGFATVYEATNASGNPFVAKLVPKEPGAKREILINDYLETANSINVIPVVDNGEHEDSWVLIMPKADISLSQYTNRTSTPLPAAEVISILLDIATALENIGDSVVHRDLKPQNVLLYKDRWCLADFGIARYAEASTAVDTRKFSMTKPYAAPEQWNLERATKATDVYALGIIAYQLVTGNLPFNGPDFREQHLLRQPPAIQDASTRLRNIIEECLYKSPAARPTAANLRIRLEKADAVPSTPGRTKLAAVNQTIVASNMKAQVDVEEARQHKSRQDGLFEAALSSLKSFITPIRQVIEDYAPSASIEASQSHAESPPHGVKLLALSNQNLVKVSLSGATLKVSYPILTRAQWEPPFEVIAHASVSVERRVADISGWSGRSHSLWYCDAIAKGEYGWYELAFMNGIIGGQPMIVPYACDPNSGERAFQGVIGDAQIAWPLTAIDRDDPEEFVDRWVEWLARAAEGTLSRPSRLPEKSTPRNWR